MNQQHQNTSDETGSERLLTIKQTAVALHIEYRQLLAAVHAGQLPFYSIHNSRKMLLPSEVLAFMRKTSQKKETENEI
jgi:hypothetical protein